MKNKLLCSVVLAAGVIFSITLVPQQTEARVMWGSQELVKGQIGKVTVLQDTPLFKLGSDGKLTDVRTIKHGITYRVYNVKNIGAVYYGVGGGYYLQSSSRVKYETPSKIMIQALGIQVNKQKLQEGIIYPKISGVVSKSVETKINNAFYNLALETQKGDAALKQQQAADEASGWTPGGDYYDTLSYKIAYNQDNILSIEIEHAMYSGGAHGLEAIDGYNFDLVTGKQLRLSDVIKNSIQLQKVNHFIKNEMIKRTKNNYQYFESNSFKSISLQSTQFYFTNGGIIIQFQEYDYGPYSNGIPSFKVPYSVFK